MKRNKNGFSLIELLIAMAIILILAAIIVPNMGKQLMAAHESAALQQINTLHQAEAQYYAEFGRYAVGLSQLGPPAAGESGPASADLIPGNFAGGHATGYIWTLGGTPAGYSISAVPEQFGNSGSRTFYSDQTRVVRSNSSREPATATSAVLGSTAR